MEFDETPVPDYAQLARLDGGVFVVLGAGQGIGRQSAHALAQAGAHVVCVGRRREPTERVANEVGGTAFVGDAQERDDMERLFSQVMNDFGRLDGVVDIIAIGLNCSALTVTRDEWEWQYDNVLSHSLSALQLGGPLIAQSGGGSITFIGSLIGHTVSEGVNSVGYSTAKAALAHLARIGAVELGPQGVRVNVVSPALVRTPRYMDNQPEEWFTEAARNYPLRRIAESADVASAVAFLASPLGRHITAQTLMVDGGISALTPSPVPLGFSGWSRPAETASA
jgi:NAD(P)-dependent dehydrogenase (short-subunit alcohol dehydrogenase family)